MTSDETPKAPTDTEELAALHEAAERATAAIGQRIIGQRTVVEHLLIALFAKGHALFVGVPGLAKTLLIQTLAEVLDLEFNRIQFTPDLMPSDVTGIDVLEIDRETGRRSFRFVRGPIFANLLLADEINRTPPKTQAALLQAMQEGQVTASGATHALPPPFHVFATQNPIEQEGTYALPEAQLDRFMLQIVVHYPDAAAEREIVAMGSPSTEPLTPVLTPEQLLEHQRLVRRIPVPPSVVDHVVAILRASRPGETECPSEVRALLRWGAGPRAGQQLLVAAQARAALQGRAAVTVNDVRALAGPVLEHRLVRSFTAESRGIGSAEIMEKILAAVPA